MKKIFLGLAFIGLLSFALPKVANADAPCAATVLLCPDGTQHIIVICDVQDDTFAWHEILCGLGNQ